MVDQEHGRINADQVQGLGDRDVQQIDQPRKSRTCQDWRERDACELLGTSCDFVLSLDSYPNVWCCVIQGLAELCLGQFPLQLGLVLWAHRRARGPCHPAPNVDLAPLPFRHGARTRTRDKLVLVLALLLAIVAIVFARRRRHGAPGNHKRTLAPRPHRQGTVAVASTEAKTPRPPGLNGHNEGCAHCTERGTCAGKAARRGSGTCLGRC
mmetsp:Transcript_40078/g.101832  ORF Transcript_40078/g.101832 Transcript_40078/m.101832 type:complete len:210 (-) Transcript_40078:137-766(-)